MFGRFTQESTDRTFRTALCSCAASCGAKARVTASVPWKWVSISSRMSARSPVSSEAPYREPGARSRSAYRLTPAGRELQVVLSALQQWGDEHLPRPEGPSMLRRVRGTDCPVHVGYLDDPGRKAPPADVAIIPAS